MQKENAFNIAVDIAKSVIQSYDCKSCPTGDMAEVIADFIETLTNRLAEMDGIE